MSKRFKSSAFAHCSSWRCSWRWNVAMAREQPEKSGECTCGFTHVQTFSCTCNCARTFSFSRALSFSRAPPPPPSSSSSSASSWSSPSSPSSSSPSRRRRRRCLFFLRLCLLQGFRAERKACTPLQSAVRSRCSPSPRGETCDTGSTL